MGDDAGSAPPAAGRLPESDFVVRCWRDAIAHPIMVPALAKDAFVRVESAERAEYQNWGTNYRAGMQEAYAPFTDGEQGLEWILRRGAERGARSIRFVGSGHSWATLSAAEEGYLVMTKNMTSPMKEFKDPVTGKKVISPRPMDARAAAGDLVADLETGLDLDKLTLPVSTVERTFSASGILAGGCHGSGQDSRLIPDLVDELTFLRVVNLGTKEVPIYDVARETRSRRDLTAPDAPERRRQFRALMLNLGALGPMVDMKFVTEPDFMARSFYFRVPLETLFNPENGPDELRDMVMRHDIFDINYFPFTSEAWVITVDRADVEPDMRLRQDRVLTTKTPLDQTKTLSGGIMADYVDWLSASLGANLLSVVARSPKLNFLTPWIVRRAFGVKVSSRVPAYDDPLVQGVLDAKTPVELAAAEKALLRRRDNACCKCLATCCPCCAQPLTYVSYKKALHWEVACDAAPCYNMEICFPIRYYINNEGERKLNFQPVVAAWTVFMTLIDAYREVGKYPVNLFGQVRFVGGSPYGKHALLCPSVKVKDKTDLWCFMEPLCIQGTLDWTDFVNDLTEIWLQIDPLAVPHWAKEFPGSGMRDADGKLVGASARTEQVAELMKERLRAVYGTNLSDFAAVREQFDPDKRFSNRYIEWLLSDVGAPGGLGVPAIDALYAKDNSDPEVLSDWNPRAQNCPRQQLVCQTLKTRLEALGLTANIVEGDVIEYTKPGSDHTFRVNLSTPHWDHEEFATDRSENPAEATFPRTLRHDFVGLDEARRAEALAAVRHLVGDNVQQTRDRISELHAQQQEQAMAGRPPMPDARQQMIQQTHRVDHSRFHPEVQRVTGDELPPQRLLGGRTRKQFERQQQVLPGQPYGKQFASRGYAMPMAFAKAPRAEAEVEAEAAAAAVPAAVPVRRPYKTQRRIQNVDKEVRNALGAAVQVLLRQQGLDPQHGAGAASAVAEGQGEGASGTDPADVAPAAPAESATPATTGTTSIEEEREHELEGVAAAEGGAAAEMAGAAHAAETETSARPATARSAGVESGDEAIASGGDGEGSAATAKRDSVASATSEGKAESGKKLSAV